MFLIGILTKDWQHCFLSDSINILHAIEFQTIFSNKYLSAIN